MFLAIEKVLYISMIVFAFMAVCTPKLRTSVIFLAVFSATSALVYVLLGAPDAALAEAVIGSTISTVIYLSALQKYRVFTIYYTNEKRRTHKSAGLTRKRNSLLRVMESFCSNKDLEPQIIYTTEEIEDTINKKDWDIIVRRHGDNFRIYGSRQNYHVEEIVEYIEGVRPEFNKAGYSIEFIME